MTTSPASPAAALPRAMFFASTSPHVLIRGPSVAYSPDEGALSVEQAMEALRAPVAEVALP